MASSPNSTHPFPQASSISALAPKMVGIRTPAASYLLKSSKLVPILPETSFKTAAEVTLVRVVVKSEMDPSVYSLTFPKILPDLLLNNALTDAASNSA